MTIEHRSRETAQGPVVSGWSAMRNVWSAAVLQAKNEDDGIGLRECIRPLLE